MNANELRIRNIVFDTEQGKPDTITAIEEVRVSLQNAKLPYTPIEKIKPVALTDERLERFGFSKRYKHNGHDLFSIGFGAHYFEVKPVGDAFNHWYFYDSEGDVVTSNLIYVHQLQNLYFVLTGEELKIKL